MVETVDVSVVDDLPTILQLLQAIRLNFQIGKLDYRFVERGSGIHGSDANLEIRWFMNRDFRLALLHDWTVPNDPEKVIDFTRYDLKATEPKDFGRNWSLMNRINQKGVRPQDKPVLLTDLPDEDQTFIRRRLPELFKAAGTKN